MSPLSSFSGCLVKRVVVNILVAKHFGKREWKRRKWVHIRGLFPYACYYSEKDTLCHSSQEVRCNAEIFARYSSLHRASCFGKSRLKMLRAMDSFVKSAQRFARKQKTSGQKYKIYRGFDLSRIIFLLFPPCNMLTELSSVAPWHPTLPLSISWMAKRPNKQCIQACGNV